MHQIHPSPQDPQDQHFDLLGLSAELIWKICYFAILQPINVCGMKINTIDFSTMAKLELTGPDLQKVVGAYKVDWFGGAQKIIRIIEERSLIALPVMEWSLLRRAAEKILETYPPTEWAYGTVGTSLPLTVFMSLLDPTVQCCHVLSSTDPFANDVFPDNRKAAFVIPKRSGGQLPVASIADVGWEKAITSKKKLLVLDWYDGDDLRVFQQFLQSIGVSGLDLECVWISRDLACPTTEGTAAYCDTILWLAAHFFLTSGKSPQPMLTPPYERKKPSRLQLTLDPGPVLHEPKFGTEMSFSSEEWLKGGKSKEFVKGVQNKKLWVDSFVARCRGLFGPTGLDLGSVSEGTDVFFAENHPQLDFSRAMVGCPSADWYYQVTIDHNVIELKTKPMTMRELFKLGNVLVNDSGSLQSKDVIQELVFDLAKEDVGLVPQDVTGAGHVHIDIASAFLNNPVMLLNFMTDIHNLGVWPFYPLVQQLRESAPLCLVQDAIGAYRKIIVAVRREQRGKTLRACGDLIADIRNNVYLKCRNQSIMKANDTNSSKKYQTLCLEKVGVTVEIRAMRPQHFARELRLMLLLLHNRILYATRTDGVVELEPPSLKTPKNQLSPESADAVAKRFIAYANEARVDPADYIDFMPPDLAEAMRRAL